MQLRQIDSAGRYLNVLREEPEEVEALFRDLLIGVTYFFRGSEAFATLEQTVIPEIFKTRFAVVSALSSQTAREAKSIEQFREAFEGRIRAMAGAHRQLSRAHWHGAELRGLIEETVAPHASRGEANITFDGPNIMLTPKATVALAMILQELSTNVAKHGALSDKFAGQVTVRWGIVDGDGNARLRLMWQEQCGCEIARPEKKKNGFGTKLIERSVNYELGGSVSARYEREGLICTIETPWNSGIGRDVKGEPSRPRNS